MYKSYIEQYKDQFLHDLDTLVRIASVSDESKASNGKPFGDEVFNAMEAFALITKRLGFTVESDDGYAIAASYLEGDDYIGILGHLDVVEANDPTLWDYPPYQLTLKNGVMYGRGVNDDKGPLLANLYAIRILLDMGVTFKKPVKVIAGGAEETTWNCMKHYFANHKQPFMAYSPDGNFPIVNGEKGILTYQANFLKTYGLIRIHTIEANQQAYTIPDYLKVTLQCNDINLLPISLQPLFSDGLATLEFFGKKALTRNPHKADNALFKFAQFITENKAYFDTGLVNLSHCLLTYFTDPFGKDCGIYHNDEVMGETTIAVYDFNVLDDCYTVSFDLRYPKGIDPLVIEKKLASYLPNLTKLRDKRLLYVDEKSELIQKLSLAYFNVMHEKPQTLTKGGASYARVLDNGVAFGATFDGYDTKPHQANENMRLDDLFKAMEIYCETIKLLACE